MKRLIVIPLICVNILTFWGCGVPQEQYTGALSQINTLEEQSQNQTSQIRYLEEQNNELTQQLKQGEKTLDELKSQIEQQKQILNIGPNHAISSEEISTNPDKYLNITYVDNLDWLFTQLMQTLDNYRKSYMPNLVVENQTDIYDQAVQLWCILANNKIQTIIKLGNFNDLNASFENSENVWLIVIYPDGSYFAIDAEDATLKPYAWADTGKVMEENTKYYGNHGFRYGNPTDFKADISYRWQLP